MAFGFSPKYTENFPLDGLSKERFLTLAVEAVKVLGWEVSYVSENGMIAYTPYSWRSYSEEFKISISEESVTLKSECTGSQMADMGKNKKNIAAFREAFEEAKSLLTNEQLEEKSQILRTALAAREDPEDRLDETPLSVKAKMSSAFSIFKPTEGYFVTPVIIILNIIVFIAMISNGVNVFLPESESLITWGGNLKPLTLNGEWWRVVTCCFVHIGLLHLLFNMYALIYIGSLLEPYLGKTRFASAYMLTGVFSSITSLWWHDELVVSAGASGAIFGMYGIFLAMLTTNLIEKSARKALLTSIGIFVAYNLMNGMKGGIDNAAHIGGLLSGIVIGYAYVPGIKKTDSAGLKFGMVALLTVVILTVSVWGLRSMPNYLQQHDEAMEKFIDNERLALQIYELPAETTKDEVLTKIKGMGIYYWNENIKLINELQKLELPEAIRKKNTLLIRYCELRINAYNLIYKGVEEDTEKYRDSITYYDNKINGLLESTDQ